LLTQLRLGAEDKPSSIDLFVLHINSRTLARIFCRQVVDIRVERIDILALFGNGDVFGGQFLLQFRNCFCARLGLELSMVSCSLKVLL
jgi:hypothetical protein